MKSYIVLIAIFLFLLSCSGNKESEKKPTIKMTLQKPTESYPNGRLVKKVLCNADTTFSYALYLPSSYSETQGYPVLFFFDPQGDGSLPLSKYKDLAEESGFILTGSNNSKNGQQAGEHKLATDRMLQDVGLKFHIDKNRMYSAGFSGGARVAVDLAMSNDAIAGVIGCGAGFPGNGSLPRTNFSYFGMVGQRDFNFSELKNLDQALDRTPLPHYLLVFDGKHEWPEKEDMKLAFTFLDFDAMKKGNAYMDQTQINSFFETQQKLRHQAKAENNLRAMADMDRRIIAFLQKLTQTIALRQELDSLVNTKSYIQLLARNQQELQLEQVRQHAYVQAMQQNDGDWWNTEMNSLLKKASAEKQHFINNRLVNYLSLISYLFADKAIRQNQLEEAARFVSIYEKVDPENPEVYYQKAIIHMRRKKTQMALDDLREAVQHHFKEKKRLLSDQDFTPLHNDPEFKKILEQAGQNSLSQRSE